MKILYGPPGTGKTYRAAREAVRIIDGNVEEATINARNKELVRQGRILWVTFHPSYSYEDFVEGFRPRQTAEGHLRYEPVDGPFKIACAAARTRSRLQVGDCIGAGGRYEVVDIDAGGVALRSDVNRSDA